MRTDKKKRKHGYKQWLLREERRKKERAAFLATKTDNLTEFIERCYDHMVKELAKIPYGPPL